MNKIVQMVIVAALMTLAPIASARFVSTDPVQANQNNGQNFNRYHYANNNPYKFVDPDGRQSVPRPINFNVSSADLTRVRAQPALDAAADRVAPKSVMATGTAGDVAGGSGLVGGSAQGPSVTVFAGANGVEATGSWGSARADTMAGSVDLVNQQVTNDQVLGAHAQLADVVVGISSFQTLAELGGLSDKSTITTPLVSASWATDGTGGWSLEVGGGVKGGLSYTRISPEQDPID